MYASEVWTLSKRNENNLEIRERKILRKMFRPVEENGIWRIRTNQELINLHRTPDTNTEIRKDYNV
jgi:hypothetical protein